MSQLIFNELSTQVLYVDKTAARQGMNNLVATALSAEALGYHEGIQTHKCISISKLCNNYNVTDWASDKEVDADRRRYFLTKCQKAPYIDDLYCESVREVADYYWENFKAIGLGVAHLRNGLALSLDSNPRFHVFIVPLTITLLDDSGNLSNEACAVHNAYSPDVVKEYRAKLRASLIDTMSTGESLFRKMQTMFPYLRLCGDAPRQVRRLSGTEPYFNEVKRHFMVLNDTMCECGREFRPKTVDFAGRESESTMQNADCRRSRMFLCHDGKKRTFWAHSKIHIDFKRIYLFADMSEEIVHIGHVGDHLPLA
jgi:hypothetical protein